MSLFSLVLGNLYFMPRCLLENISFNDVVQSMLQPLLLIITQKSYYWRVSCSSQYYTLSAKYAFGCTCVTVDGCHGIFIGSCLNLLPKEH